MWFNICRHLYFYVHLKKLIFSCFSDLVPYSNQLTFGATAEILERPDGYSGLQKRYGFRFGDIKALDPGLRYNAIANNQAQVIDAFSTDGKLIELNLTILEDDKEFFPPYYAVPLVNNTTLENNPQIKEVLNRLNNVISDEDMQQLNYRVDVKKEDLEAVARNFLTQKGMIQ